MNRHLRCALQPLVPGRQQLPAEAARYLVRVHRLRSGQRFVAFDPAARVEADATLVSDDSKRATCDIGELREASLVSPEPVTLLQAVGKGDKVERVVRDATQLGARRIVLVQSERSVPRIVDKQQEKQRRLTRVALESARQCGRGDMPAIEGPVPLAEALRNAANLEIKLVFDAAGQTSLAAALEGRAPGATIAALVGPEGGFTSGELTAACAAGFSPVTLGPFVLRTETAAVVAMARIAEHC